MSDVEMVRKRANWMPFILIGAALVYVAFFSLREGGKSGCEHVGVGGKVTDISFAALTAEVGVGSEDWAGKVVLINFWGTWCPPCRKEFPHLVQLHRRFSGDDGFRLVSVSCPSGATEMDQFAAATAEHLERAGATFPTYYDAIGRGKRRIEEAASLSSGGIPITIVVDPAGVIRGVWQGFREGDELEMEGLVAELLRT